MIGLSRWCFVETNSFEFALEVGVSVFCIFEQNKGFMSSISMGKES